jgi:2-dehydropantoate 2-reductase
LKIAVLGSGGVGGYFGGRLARRGAAEVSFIARGAHLGSIVEDGLRVRSVFGDFEVRVAASDDPRTIGPCDFVLFCVKSFDTESAIELLPPLLTEGTAVVSLQNGVDNEEKIAAAIGAEHVLAGAAFIFASIVEPGVIAHTGGPARIVLGEMGGSSSPRLRTLIDTCGDAGIAAESSDDIRAVLWNKFAFICAQAGITCVTRRPLGVIRSIPETWDAFVAILREVVDVARAEGVELGAGAADRHVAFAEGLEPDSFSSLYNDMVAGRRMELDALHGELVRRADRHGVPVPVSRAVYAFLRPWELANAAAQPR